MTRHDLADGVSVIHGDALAAMRELADGSVGAVVTDPPYCSGAATESAKGAATHQGLRSETIRKGRFSWFGSDNMTTAGLAYLLRELAVEADRLLTPGGSLLVFCDALMAPSLTPAIESAGYRALRPVIWNKGHFGCGIGFRPQYEMVMHFTRRSPAFHAMDVGNVRTVPRVDTDDRDHPAEKPVDLLMDLIRVVTPERGTVLDPFAGSFATGVACVHEGRRFLGVEKEAKYVDVGLRRLRDALDAGLFREPTRATTPSLFGEGDDR